MLLIHTLHRYEIKTSEYLSVLGIDFIAVFHEQLSWGWDGKRVY